MHSLSKTGFFLVFTASSFAIVLLEANKIGVPYPKLKEVNLRTYIIFMSLLSILSKLHRLGHGSYMQKLAKIIQHPVPCIVKVIFRRTGRRRIV